MSDTPEYDEVMGFGQPILSVRVVDSQVTLYRKESEGLMPSLGPLGSLHFHVVSPDEPLGGGGMVGHPWGGTVVGDQRIICGEMPADALTAEAILKGGGVAQVHLASGVWLVVAPRDQKAKITFRNAQGRSVKQMTIRVWPAVPSREELMAQAMSDWDEDPEYVPTLADERSVGEEAHTWSERIRRYGLGEPLVTIPVRDQAASLYRQRHTGRLWHAITGIGGSLGPIDDFFGCEASHFEGWQVMYGTLPPKTVSAEAVTDKGEQIAVHLVPGAFIAVMPSAHAVDVTFRNSRGRAIWTHRFHAEGISSDPP
ncbi:MAG: hypothetical protein M3P51_01900 [Chloroflexota bacterium]|nr:hypothetical protein [Chloroflexota bacterium]